MKVWRGVGGFTLGELLLALFVGAVLMSAVYVTMISGQRSSAGVERKVAAQQDVRAALEIMTMDISMASYNPNFILGIWTDSSACAGASPNQAYKGIQEATPTVITVEMDIGESDSIGDNENEIIRYTYDAGNQYITRRTNCGSAQPFLGAVAGAPAGTRTVRVINNRAGINNGPGQGTPAVFRYYDSNGTELYPYPGKNPGDIPNIRRIDITLAVETEEMDPGTNAFRQMIYSTSVLVRNHAIN
jgi:type II secretory pathway pseudopilin PulG